MNHVRFKSSIHNRLTSLALGDTLILILGGYLIRQFTDITAPPPFAFSECIFIVSIIFLSYLIDIYAINYNIQRNRTKEIVSPLIVVTISILLLIIWNIWVSRYGVIDYWLAIGVFFLIFQNIYHNLFYSISNNPAFAKRVLVIGLFVIWSGLGDNNIPNLGSIG